MEQEFFCCFADESFRRFCQRRFMRRSVHGVAAVDVDERLFGQADVDQEEGG